MPYLRRCSIVLLVTVLSWAASGPPAQAAAAAATATPTTAVAADQPVPAGQPAPAGPPADYVQGCPARPAPGRYTCYSLHRTGLRSFGSTIIGYGPTDLHSAYALPALTSTAGTGQTVYVIDAFGYPNAESDLATYRGNYGLGACTTANGCFRKLDQRGGTSYPAHYDEGWAGETALDLDMVSAVCPRCHITLIQADTNANDLFTAVDRANQLGAKYVSMSWGGPEDGNEPSDDLQYFNRSGVVYAASSGDSGYAAGASYPATSRNSVAVGGTTLDRTGSGRGWGESVWVDPARGYGTGSGCSAYVAKPVWQQIIPSSVCSRRSGNDVAAVADPDTGVAVYQQGSRYGDWSVSGGTSAAAPIIAAVYALAGAPAAGSSPASYPYARPGAVNDVVSGNNGTCAQQLLCTAAAGWDGPTGLGTPNGLTAFRGAAPVVAPGAYQPLPGARLLDTRSGLGAPLAQVGASVPLSVQVGGRGGVPSTGVAAVVLNVTATRPVDAGHLSVRAAGTSSGTSNLNFGRGQTVAGLVVTRLSSSGAMEVLSSARSDVLADVAGYYLAGTVVDAGAFTPVVPARLLDTRIALGAPIGKVPAGGSVDLQVGGRGGVPASGVGAVVANVTAAQPTGAGYVTVYPDLVAKPFTSNLNFLTNQTVPNLVAVPVAANGKVRLAVSGASSDLLADAFGYFRAGAPTVAGAFGALTPARVFDTRTGSGFGGTPTALAAGSTTRIKLTGVGGIPSAGVSAVVLSLTAVGSTGGGFATLYADGSSRPPTSTLNYERNQIVANLVMVPVSPQGYIQVSVNAAGTSGLFADVAGYYSSGP